MRLVERVRRECAPVVPYLVDESARLGLVRPLADAKLWVRETALDKLDLQLLHHGELLLAHRLAELVGHAAREAAEQARKKHHLFLIDADAVRVLQVLLHQRMVVDDLLLALLAADECRDVLHRPRSVKRVHCDKVGKSLRLKRHQPLLHAVRFELEKPRCFATSEKLVCLLVVVGDLVRVEKSVGASQRLWDARIVRPQDRNALLFDGERLESEEVHLEKTDRLDEMAVVLRRQKRLALGRHHRQRLGQRIARDDYAARVDARLAHAALEPTRALHKEMHRLVLGVEGVDESLRVVAVRVAVLVLRARRLLEGDLRRLGNEPRKLVGVGERIVHHAADVLDDALRRHLPESHDVRHMVRAVLLRHELKHLAAPRVVEVHVDIGHRDSVGVKKPLEQQVVLYRVDVRDAKRVGNGRASRRTAPRPHPHAHLARIRDVVVYDEEVAGEAHRLYDAKLEINTLLDILGNPVRSRFPVPRSPSLPSSVPYQRCEIVGLELNP